MKKLDERDPFGVGKLLDTPIKSITEKFAFKSDAVKNIVIRELKTKDAEQGNSAAFRIATALHEYRIRVVNDLHHISDSSEITRATQAAKYLRKTIRSLQLLGRDAGLEYYLPALSDDLDHPRTPEEFYEDLGNVAERLEDFVKSTKPRRGREPLDTLDDFVYELMHIYRDTTGSNPGFSSKPVSKPGSRAKETHGPFVRFCEDVVSVVNPTDVGSVFESVRRLLRGTRSPHRRKNWA